MLDALDTYSPTKAEYDVRQVLIRELRSGMVIDDHVLSKDGSLVIFKEGTILTPIWLERLGNFARTRGVQEQIRVRIPRLGGMSQLSRLAMASPCPFERAKHAVENDKNQQDG